MRQDRVFKRRVREFISDSLKDVRKSGKSVYRYFTPSFRNKRLFKYNSAWTELRPGHAGSLFGQDEKSSTRWNNLTEVMFETLLREAKLRRVYLLMPNKEGEFRSSQEKLLTRFTDVILSKLDAKEREVDQGKPKPRAEIEKIAGKSQKNLEEYGKLETISPFGYNEKTGLIEGSVANIMDPDGTVLKGSIDPENENLILFSSEALGVCFAMDNNEKDLVLFANRSTNEMVNNENIVVGEPLPTEEDSGVDTAEMANAINESDISKDSVMKSIHQDSGSGLELEPELEEGFPGEGMSIPSEQGKRNVPKSQKQFSLNRVSLNQLNKRNPAFESMLKGAQMPISQGSRTSSPTNRVTESGLPGEEKKKAIAEHTTEKEQKSLNSENQKEGAGGAPPSEQGGSKKQKKETGSGLLATVLKIGIPTIAIINF